MCLPPNKKLSSKSEKTGSQNNKHEYIRNQLIRIIDTLVFTGSVQKPTNKNNCIRDFRADHRTSNKS